MSYAVLTAREAANISHERGSKMSETKTRKAVVTTAQVQSALDDMNALRAEIGLPVDGKVFDKGLRGKGFAVYVDGSDTAAVVNTYETKEDALREFSAFAEIGNVILGASHVKVVKPTAKAAA